MLGYGSFAVSDSAIELAIVMCQYNLYMWVYKLTGPVCAQAGNTYGLSDRGSIGTDQHCQCNKVGGYYDLTVLIVLYINKCRMHTLNAYS